MRQLACALVVAVTLGPAVPALAAKAAPPPSKQELEAARKLLERYVPEAENRPTLWSAMAGAALLEGQPAIGQAAMERAALVFGGGDLQSQGKVVARTWLGAAKELVGDPVSRDTRASFILLYIETAVRYDRLRRAGWSRTVATVEQRRQSNADVRHGGHRGIQPRPRDAKG